MEGLKCQVLLDAWTQDPGPRMGDENVGSCCLAQPLLQRRWSALSVLWCECNSTAKVNVGPFSVTLQSLHLRWHFSPGTQLFLPCLGAASSSSGLPRQHKSEAPGAAPAASLRCVHGQVSSLQRSPPGNWHVPGCRHSGERAEQCVQCLLAICLASAKGIDCQMH